MRYFFIPGRLRNLTIAELNSVFSLYARPKNRTGWVDADQLEQNFTFQISPRKSNEYIEVESDLHPDMVKQIFHRLGASVKYGVLIEEEESFYKQYITRKKVVFGVSVYNSDDRKRNRMIQKEATKKIKEYLAANGVRSRFLNSPESEISTATIIHNKVLENGFELNVFYTSEGVELGYTEAVQDIEQFSFIDYKRPAIDKNMGMIPPKLARTMVNLAGVQPGGTIWDPFCGVGTILLEALLLDYDVLGSDISDSAIAGSELNIGWLAEHFDMKDRKYSLFQADILNLKKAVNVKLRKTPISAVVFEPYMGPPVKRLIKPERANKLLADMEAYYKGLSAVLERINQPRLVMVGVVPAYKTFQGWKGARFSNLLSKRWEILSNNSTSEGLQWSRSNSIIRRDIIVARLKK